MGSFKFLNHLRACKYFAEAIRKTKILCAKFCCNYDCKFTGLPSQRTSVQSQLTFTCPKSTIETLEKYVKYVQN